MLALAEGDYDVVIDTSLEEGYLTYGEFLHCGDREEEVLLSAHICHPSLANDNCSGLALLAYLAKHLDPMQTKYSYRFLFAPGTIGAIAWLSRNEARVAGSGPDFRIVCRRRRWADLQEVPQGRHTN